MTHGTGRIGRLLRVIGFSSFVLAALSGTAPGDSMRRADSQAPALSEAAVRTLESPPAELPTGVRRELEEAWRSAVAPALTAALSNPEADISTKLLGAELEGKPYLRFFAGGYEAETRRKVVVEAFHGAGPEGVEHHYGKWFRPITLGKQSIEPIDFSADRAVISTLTDDLSAAMYWQAGAFYVEVRAPERSATLALAEKAHQALEQRGVYQFPARPSSRQRETAASQTTGGATTDASASPDERANTPQTAETSGAPVDDIPTESEPNNDRDQASPLAIGKKTQGKIEPRNDADWYRVEVNHQGALAVKIDRVPDNLDVTFQVFDGTGALLQYWVPTRGAGQAIEKVVDLKARGTYYLEVRDGGNNASSPEPYELSLAFIPTADRGEPNDGQEAASPIPVGKPIEANILPRNDADWYWLAVGHQGALRIAVPVVPPELDVTFQVFDGTGALLQYWVPTRGAGQAIEKVVDLKARGTYYLEVRDGGNNARSSEPYTLALGFTATADDGEPNDSRENASPIAIGELVKANILPRKDGDWYRLAVQRQGDLKVTIHDVPAELDMTFQVFDEKGKRLQYWVPTRSAGQDIEHVVRLPSAGVYYLEVRDSGNNARSGKPYSLSTSLLPDAAK